jgi:hypothetical protein
MPRGHSKLSAPSVVSHQVFLPIQGRKYRKRPQFSQVSTS